MTVLQRSAKHGTESSGNGEAILSDDEETGSGDGGILPRASGEGFYGAFFIISTLWACDGLNVGTQHPFINLSKWLFPFPEIVDPFFRSPAGRLSSRLCSFCREKYHRKKERNVTFG